MAKKTFENSMKQLEQIVSQLESGDLPLEAALKKFEEGMELSRFCSRKLEETERRITQLMRSGSGEVLEKPFIAADEQSDES
jgi:exodeoxyribonuclease VII small subunit